jgi:hypothetical protein
MSNFNVNISADAIMAQREEQSVNVRKNTFNERNYLQARLGANEDSKEITIRLLPFTEDGGTPFHKIHMHQVRVNKGVSASGWKRFPCPIENKIGGSCPFCETAQQARSLKKSTTLDVERKKFEEVEKANYAKSMWIVRCIERGHEEDGVKFWLFSDSKKKDGVYDKIFAIFKKRAEKGRNIFDLNEGKDLCLNLSKDSKGSTVITVTDDEDYTPLTTNYELGLSWIKDTKKWTDVYTIKPYDYMSVIVQGGVPVFSKEKNAYVDKEESINEAQKEIEENLTPIVKDLSKPEDEVKIETTQEVKNEVVQEFKQQVLVSSFDLDDDDDMPF